MVYNHLLLLKCFEAEVLLNSGKELGEESHCLRQSEQMTLPPGSKRRPDTSPVSPALSRSFSMRSRLFRRAKTEYSVTMAFLLCVNSHLRP